MKTEEARALVVRVWEAFGSRDEDRIAALFTDDAEWKAPSGNPTAVALDYPHHLMGARAIARFVAEDMYKLFSDVNVAFVGFYADGATVVVEERMSAMLPNGTPYANDYVFVFECRGNRVSGIREYMDTLGAQRQVFADGRAIKDERS
jgi:ketosteroid isomerase-like protein